MACYGYFSSASVYASNVWGGRKMTQEIGLAKLRQDSGNSNYLEEFVYGKQGTAGI